jgi:Mg2+-importing ATPase
MALFWQIPLVELERRLGIGSNGLSSAEAAVRLLRYGANTLNVRRRYSLLFKILSRFRNPLVLILLFAAAISALTGDVGSLVIILAIVLLSILLDSTRSIVRNRRLSGSGCRWRFGTSKGAGLL